MRKITMNDVSVMSVSYVQHTFGYFLDSMQRCGLSKIDLWGGAPHYCRANYNTGYEASLDLRRMKQELDDRGMQIVIYTPETLNYPFSYSTDQPALRGRTWDYMKAAIDDAHYMGTDRVFLNTGCGPRDGDREAAFERTVESIAYLSDYARRMDTKLVLEQLQPYESNLSTTIGDIQRFVKEVDSPALTVCLDLTAMEVAGENMQQYIDAFGDKLEWVHYSDSHHEILGSGTYGREKLEGWVRTLEANDYQGCIDLEINDSIYWEDPHRSVQESADYLRRFLPEK